MPYSLYELNKSLWAPVLPWLQAAADFFEIPDDAPFAQPARRFSAGCDLLVRLCKRYTKPAFGLSETVVDGRIYPQLRDLIYRYDARAWSASASTPVFAAHGKHDGELTVRTGIFG